MRREIYQQNKKKNPPLVPHTPNKHIRPQTCKSIKYPTIKFPSKVFHFAYSIDVEGVEVPHFCNKHIYLLYSVKWMGI